ncbi:MAG: hypothetical protein RL543_411, partial [Pseudomonadota bacterium]
IDQRMRYVFAPEPDPALINSAGLLVAPASKAEAYRSRMKNCNVQFEPLGTLDRTASGVPLETYALFRITGAKLEPSLPPRGPIRACRRKSPHRAHVHFLYQAARGSPPRLDLPVPSPTSARIWYCRRQNPSACAAHQVASANR